MTDQVHFSERLIKAGFNYAYGISAADLTGNGHLDLITADTEVGLYWFENDGQGNFTQYVIHQRQDEWLESHAVADINGDGRPEIVIVENINGSVLYFAFEGDPRDRNAWSHHYVCRGQLPGAYDVAVADFDGDNRLDIVAAAERGSNEVRWWRNEGV